MTLYMMLETNQHVFYDCLIPSTQIDHVNDHLELPGIPFTCIPYVNPLPKACSILFFSCV